MDDVRDISCDLVVVGAGPAGTNAALAAAQLGLDVVLIDEAPAAGGQVWRAPAASSAGEPETDPDLKAGSALRAELADSSVHCLLGASVWSVAPGFVVSLCDDDGAWSVRARRLVAATGAWERTVPFPGWTLPGVFGLAAGTVLQKRSGRLPGRRIAIAGRGPLLMALAAKAIKAGQPPVALIDAGRRSDWVRAAAGFAGSPAVLAQGAAWAAQVMRARVQHRYAHAVVAAHGGSRLEAIDVAPLDAAGAPAGATSRIAVDTLFVGDGLVAGAELTRLLGAAHDHDALRGGLVPRLDDFGRTTVPGLYAAGDGAGIRGAGPAVLAGRLAGLAAASDAGRLPKDDLLAAAAPISRRLRRIAPIADASCRLMRVPDARIAAIPPETVVCRCEDVTRGELEVAIARGAGELNQLKHFTRLGMGPCQGRMCGATAAALLALATGEGQTEVGFTPRTPLRPVPLDRLIGTFDYADLPVPKPAPL